MITARVLGASPATRQASALQRARRRVVLCWALLVLNVLPFYAGAPHLLPIPGIVGKMITQGALVAAFLLALSVNRRAAVRPSVFILFLVVMASVAMTDSLRTEFVLGSIFRACRLLLFVATIWLLALWWGRRDMLLVKAHLITVWAVLGSALLGLLAAPGIAMSQGRLGGGLWPIPPTQIGRYAATAIGLTTVLWLSGVVRREMALVAVVVAMPMLLLSHTRTALVSMLAGLLIAGLSLFRTRARVRRAFAIGAVALSIGALTLSSVVTTWLARGQDTDQLSNLTGRTAVWEMVLAEPRNPFDLVFGTGLTDKSFNGLAIDSNWIATYYELGLVGVVLNAAMLLFLLIAAAFRPHGAKRALALFLVAYCLVSSFTETGLGDASLALLELALAASLLIPTTRKGP